MDSPVKITNFEELELELAAAYAAGVDFGRQECIEILDKLHERYKTRHNYYDCAVVDIMTHIDTTFDDRGFNDYISRSFEDQDE